MKDKIICIVGRSGSGKTTAAEYLEELYGLKSIQSYTTRPKRNPNETGHTFVTKDEFDEIRGDVVAYNLYNGYEYAATKTQIEENDIYVVDIPGLLELKEKYDGSKEIVVVGLFVDDSTALQRMMDRGDSPQKILERLESDKCFANLARYCDLYIKTDNSSPAITARTIAAYLEFDNAR